LDFEFDFENLKYELKNEFVASCGKQNLWRWNPPHKKNNKSKVMANWHTCIASSLVGLITMTFVPFLGRHQAKCIISIAGNKKARVLPEPVCAAPITSLPCNKRGMALAWI
jgi:hypothetical protein